MGQHSRSGSQPSAASVRRRKPHRFPPLPDNVGRRTSWRNINGVREHSTIVDEIRQQQHDYPVKTFVLQRIRREPDGRIHLRLGYYMIGVKPRMRGRWTWGQFATMIRPRDLRALIKEAHRRKWI